MARKGNGWAKFSAVAAVLGGAVLALGSLNFDIVSFLGDFQTIAQIVVGVGSVSAGVLLWNK